jgi:hypothetical protein
MLTATTKVFRKRLIGSPNHHTRTMAFREVREEKSSPPWISPSGLRD